MINPKNICIFSCIGFFLSFFIGILSDVRFSQVLLRAFLFALLFAILGAGVSVVYSKFLSDGSGTVSVDSDSLAQKSVGGVVNIVVDDENLADDGLSPKFTVVGHHADLSDKSKPAKTSPVMNVASGVSEEPSPEEPSPLADDSAASFQPMGLGSVAKSENTNTQKTPEVPAETESAAETASASASPVAASGPSGSLDELPDIGNMGFADSSEGVASDTDPEDEVISDTDFATGGAKMHEQPISGDTSVMAKAIQTLLAKDN